MSMAHEIPMTDHAFVRIPTARLEGNATLLFKFRPQFLSEPGVFVVLSMVSHSPLLDPAGSRQLIDYLAALPHPSIIVVADTLNRHNIIAMGRGGRRNGVSEDSALNLALKCGDMYKEAMDAAIRENKEAAGTGKVTTVRWQDIIDEKVLKQEAIAHKHYEENEKLRARIDEVALGFLYYRLPQCKNVARRLPHMVNYLLGEIPILVSGPRYDGRHYPTLLYPTSTESYRAMEACPRANAMCALVDEIHNNPDFAELRKELLAEVDGLESRNGVAILPIVHHPQEKKIAEAKGCPVRNLIRRQSRGLVDHEADGV